MSIIEKGLSTIKGILKEVNSHSTAAQQPASTDSNDTVYAADEALLPFLQQNSCKYELIDDDDEHFARYCFDYQGGHFVAMVSKHGFGVEITFPRVVHVPFNCLNSVRKVVNENNCTNTLQKFVYRFFDEDNTIGISICFAMRYFSFNELHHALTQCFVVQRELNDDIKAAIKESDDNDTNDLQADTYCSKRELFLLRQMEISHDNAPAQRRISPNEALTLEHIFHNLIERPDLIFKHLQIVTDHLEEITDSDDIKQFNVAAITTQATLIVHYASPRFKDTDVATVIITQADADDFARYFRVTVTISVEEPSGHNSLNKTHMSRTSFNFLYGVNNASSEKMEAEFDYMWKDAIIKRNEGNLKDIDENQRLLININNASIAYNTYWALRYMNQERYLEAIAHLENAFYEIKNSFFSLDDKMKEVFFELCYQLGFCYTELCLYEKAFYYLDLVSQSHRIRYAMEWINAQANANDIRIFRSIAIIEDDLRENYGNDDEVPESIMKFMSFLHRRRAFALVSFGKLNEAEKEFKALLNDPNSRDYALSELAYIEKLRKADNKESEAETENGNDTLPPPFSPEQD